MTTNKLHFLVTALHKIATVLGELGHQKQRGQYFDFQYDNQAYRVQKEDILLTETCNPSCITPHPQMNAPFKMWHYETNLTPEQHLHNNDIITSHGWSL